MNEWDLLGIMLVITAIIVLFLGLQASLASLSQSQYSPNSCVEICIVPYSPDWSALIDSIPSAILFTAAALYCFWKGVRTPLYHPTK